MIKTYNSLLTQKQNKGFMLTKLSIVERQARSRDARIYSKDVIAALAAEHRRVAPPAAQEQ